MLRLAKVLCLIWTISISPILGPAPVRAGDSYICYEFLWAESCADLYLLYPGECDFTCNPETMECNDWRQQPFFDMYANWWLVKAIEVEMNPGDDETNKWQNFNFVDRLCGWASTCRPDCEVIGGQLRCVTTDVPMIKWSEEPAGGPCPFVNPGGAEPAVGY